MSAVAKLESGHTPSKKEPGYWNGSIPWVSLFDTEGLQGKEIFETAKMVTEEGINNSSARILPKGTVVFSRTATVGKTTVMGCEMATSQDFANYICGPKLHNHFLVFLFRSMGRTWKSLMAGSIHNTIYMPVFKALQIILPPLHEQRAIATALSDVEALLVALEQLVAKKRDLKRAAMQQLLTGQTRLPGFSGEWEETTLGAIGECVIGLTYHPDNVVEHGLLVLRSSNVQGGRLAYENNVYVDLEVNDRLMTRPGDILVCVRNGSRSLIGKSAVIDECAAGTTFGAFMTVYRTTHWRFISHAFQSESIQRQIRDNIGATINQITNKDMKALRVKLPSACEQTAIATVLSDMDAELAALEQRLAKTRSLKQGMMQELLTGRTRLV